jgi:hypothetical protein
MFAVTCMEVRMTAVAVATAWLNDATCESK